MRFIIFLSILLVLCSFSASSQCEEYWQCSAWGSCHEGISERDCYDINSCFTLKDVPAETAFCREELPYCYDDIINQDESDVDCGGTVCDKCALGKNCLRNSDCAWGECIKQTCAFEESPVSAAPSSYSASWALTFVIAMLAAAIVIVAISMMKRLRKYLHFQGLSESDISERLKKQKIIVLTNKEVKERIIVVSKMPKKSKLKKFVDNVNGYLDSIKPEPRRELKKAEKKDLLNEKSFKTQAHPAKEYMLSNIKEVYDE